MKNILALTALIAIIIMYSCTVPTEPMDIDEKTITIINEIDFCGLTFKNSKKESFSISFDDFGTDTIHLYNDTYTVTMTYYEVRNNKWAIEQKQIFKCELKYIPNTIRTIDYR